MVSPELAFRLLLIAENPIKNEDMIDTAKHIHHVLKRLEGVHGLGEIDLPAQTTPRAPRLEIRRHAF